MGSLVRSSAGRSHPRSGSSGQAASGSSSRPRPSEGDLLQLGPSIGDYRVGAFHDTSGSGKGKAARRRDPSVESGESADPIIRRQISVTVEHERASRSNSIVV